MVDEIESGDHVQQRISNVEAAANQFIDNYTIDMTGLVISGIDSPTMHYVGTMPSFDFPFLN